MIIIPYSYSPLRYPGGKTKLYDFVKDIVLENDLYGKTYIEPFAGGAGLALKLLLKNDVGRIVINDLDTSIYSFWYTVLNEPESLCRFIYDVPISVDMWKQQRKIYMHSSEYSRLELAQAVLYLNRTNISGVISGGLIGGINQDGTYLMDARFNKESIIKRIGDIADRKSSIFLYNMDANDFIKSKELKHFYNALINFDPPYVKKGQQLYKNAFTEEDHTILRDSIKKCSRKWIVTYDICDITENLYKNYRHGYIDINYSANVNRKAQELIVFSNNIAIPKGIELV